MMKRKYIIILMTVFMMFTSSCAYDNDVQDSTKAVETINYEEYIPKTNKLYFSKGDTETVSLKNDTYAIRFKTEKTFYSLELKAYSDSEEGSVTVDIYKWNNDYSTTVSGEKSAVYSFFPLFSKEEKLTPSIGFSINDPLTAGEYLIVFSTDNTDAEIEIGEKADDTSGIVCYKNGIESNKVPSGMIEFN